VTKLVCCLLCALGPGGLKKAASLGGVTVDICRNTEYVKLHLVIEIDSQRSKTHTCGCAMINETGKGTASFVCNKRHNFKEHNISLFVPRQEKIQHQQLLIFLEYSPVLF
jgi:hypothetical protein